MNKTVRILGTHGVPATYGGFETAAENIALFLVERGWRVIVYCQTTGSGPIVDDSWRGIERVFVPARGEGWKGTSRFDLASIRHASRFRDICLTFGYNTAVFNTLQKVKGIPNVINMDGMEWTRSRWGPVKQGILLTNERLARILGTRLIADHPEIERYLARGTSRRKIAMITYGAHSVEDAPTELVHRLGLEPGRYLSVICRPIPENSILEIVEAFSRRPRNDRLVVLGDFDTEADPYHRKVWEAASSEVLFPGAIYDPETVQALRFHSKAYVHGHTVGGTNPSLVEAMAAGNPVIAHDNVYNRWTAGEGARFFRGTDDLAQTFSGLLDEPSVLLEMSEWSRKRHASEFTWEQVAGQYEELLIATSEQIMTRSHLRTRRVVERGRT